MLNAAARVLLVEDDASIRDGVVESLQAEGFEVYALADGRDFVRVAREFHPDIGVLDIRLPQGPDGFELGRQLRTTTDAALLYLTAADGIDDRLRGFETGADDYLVKPFSLAELLARIRAVLRRSGRLASPTWQLRDLTVDEARRAVLLSGQEVDLTTTEFELLCALGRRRGETVSKVQLLGLVWGFDEFDPNLVEVHVSALRRKLETAGSRLIHTVRGAGYSLR